MREREIRPKGLHNKILSLSKKDTIRFMLPQKKQFKKVKCPACGSNKRKFAFKKFGMDYVTCDFCYTLYLCPRLNELNMNKIYNQMESVLYWETDFYKKTMNARRETMFVPRAQKVIEVSKKFLPMKIKKPRLIDIGCGYGIFLEEIKKGNFFNDIIGVEPTKSLAEATKSRGFKVVEQWIDNKNVDSIGYKASVLTCFEVLEHVNDPLIFLNTFSKLLNFGGLFMLSFPSISGLDTQLLWNKSNTIYPPHHINLFSVEGIKNLIKRTNNLELVDLSTPGKLDLDIVYNAYKEGVVQSLGHFFDYIFWRQDQKLLKDFQNFCSKNYLSSHVFLILKKV